MYPEFFGIKQKIYFLWLGTLHQWEKTKQRVLDAGQY